MLDEAISVSLFLQVQTHILKDTIVKMVNEVNKSKIYAEDERLPIRASAEVISSPANACRLRIIRDLHVIRNILLRNLPFTVEGLRLKKRMGGSLLRSS